MPKKRLVDKEKLLAEADRLVELPLFKLTRAELEFIAIAYAVKKELEKLTHA